MFKAQVRKWLPALLALGSLSQAPGLSAQVFPSVSIPEELQGLFILDVTDTTPLSPLAATDPTDTSDDLYLYLTGVGDICIQRDNAVVSNDTVDLIASNPQLRNGPFGKVY